MPETSSPPLPGFWHFLEQGDTVTMLVLAVLVLMSVASWYQIAAKAWQQWRVRKAGKHFLDSLAGTRNYQEAEELLARTPPKEPFGRILAQGMEACQLLRTPTAHRGFEITSPDGFIDATLEKSLASEEYALEKGLSVLASVGSTAPFVGLFGTVWGIYHALLSIGLSGQASLGQVAGPVGEALIMTACGLAVAIPAVLAYNAFVRANRNLTGRMESHAHRVFTLLGTGNIPENHAHRVRALPVPEDKAKRRA
ncbi:MAG: MotA/TolQ/ExbB proton channel family protein [Azoarcus sp.]|jgi:biopolymer transport protein ExbB|nr:MotA/TolQ/ExbB proton channel family protein [Azoarcus sp.]